MSDNRTATGERSVGSNDNNTAAAIPAARRTSGRRRTGSAGSSARGTRAQHAQGVQSSQSTPSTDRSTAKPKKKGVARFLALLCCASPGGEEGTDENSQEAAKRITKPQSVTQPQPTPTMSVAREEDPSTSNAAVEHKEKASTPAGIPSPSTNQNSTMPLTEKPTISQPLTSQQETVTPPAVAAPLFNEKSDDVAPPEHLLTTQRLLNEKFLPDIPISAAASSKPKMPQLRRNESERHAQQLAAWPPAPLVSAEPISEDEDEVINDRAPEQARTDADLEMSEAQPSVPIAPDELAPRAPPPEIRRQSTDRPGLKRGEASSIVNTPGTPRKNESLSSIAEPPQQKWLLPAMRPEHKGRKCLVLDLDETLVHSSFKVSIGYTYIAITLTICRFYIKPT